MGVTYRSWLGVNRGFVGIASDFWRSFTGRRAHSLWIARLIEQRIPMLSKLESVLDQSIGITHTISVTYGGRPCFVVRRSISINNTIQYFELSNARST